MGVAKVVLETDALMTTQALQSDAFRLSAMDGLVHELKEFVSEEFTGARVLFVPRNRVLQ